MTGGHDSVNVDLWTKSGKRLYINNYHERGTIYLNLLTGKFQTKNGSPLSDIYYEIQDSGRILYVWSNSGELRISLRDKKPQRETSEQRENEDKEDKKTEEDKNRNSREGEDRNGREKEPVTSQTWLDRRVESIRGLLEPRSAALLLLFNVGYGIVSIAAVVIAGLMLLLGLMGTLFGSLGTVAWTLFALFGAPWGQAIEMVSATVGSFIIATVSIAVLEQFGIDIGE